MIGRAVIECEATQLKKLLSRRCLRGLGGIGAMQLLQ